MENLSGFGLRRVGVLTALIALTASLLVVPAEQAAKAEASLTATDGTCFSSRTYFLGSGTESSPYLIRSAGDLVTLAACTDQKVHGADEHYKQTTDINMDDIDGLDLSATRGSTELRKTHVKLGIIGYEEAFLGSYDGDGHVVSNLNLTETDTFAAIVGLFAKGNACTVKNLTVSGSLILHEGATQAGMVMGNSSNCTLDNVTAFGEIQGGKNGVPAASPSTGGILGHGSGTLKNSSSHVDFNARSGFDGGAVGRFEAGEIVDVTVSREKDPSTGLDRGKIEVKQTSGRVGGLAGFVGTGNVTVNRAASSVDIVAVDNSGSSYVGGLIGETGGTGTISNSFSTGAITFENYSVANIGGLVGRSTFPITKSYSQSDISAKVSDTAHNGGGLVGRADASIEESYFFGAITLTTGSTTNGDWGGLIGLLVGSGVSKAYVNEASALPVAKRIVGRIASGGTNSAETLTAAEFQEADSFVSWDFADTWVMGDNAPIHQFANPPSPPESETAPASSPSPAPSPSPSPAPTPDATPAPTPAATPTPTPPVTTPPAADPPVTPRALAAPTPPPAPNPAPAADPPAPGPGLAFLTAQEIFEGAVILGTDTEELIMPAFVLHDIATRLAPEGAPLEEGALLIESGITVHAVLLVAVGDLRLSAADIGNSIQFTLNIPGFDSSSLTLAVQKQTLVWAFWAQLGLLGVAAATAITLAWWFVTRGRNRRANPDARSHRVGTTPLGQPPAYPGGSPGI